MQKLFFNKVKEDRDRYFVEYSPPLESWRFAELHLIFPDQTDKSKIVEAMDDELRGWLKRYPIPVMVTAFEAADSVIQLRPHRECNSLIGFLSSDKMTIQSEWRLLKDEEIPDDALNREYLRNVYFDIPFKTSDDIEHDIRKHKRLVLILKWFDYLWTIIVPLLLLVLPEFVSWIASVFLVYGLIKILVELLKKTGTLKKSRRQIEKDEEEREMQHCYYHRKKNPEAFMRLKIENFEREAKERTRKEAEALKKGARIGRERKPQAGSAGQARI